METFELNEYYTLNCRLIGASYNKLYTCQVVGMDKTHLSIIDATDSQIIIPRENINGECRVISKEKFEIERNKIRDKNNQKELTAKKDDEYKSYYQP